MWTPTSCLPFSNRPTLALSSVRSLSTSADGESDRSANDTYGRFFFGGVNEPLLTSRNLRGAEIGIENEVLKGFMPLWRLYGVAVTGWSTANGSFANGSLRVDTSASQPPPGRVSPTEVTSQ
jgi:hypothetical protein